MLRYTLIILFFFTSLLAYSQSLIKGTISDEGRKPVDGVVVSVVDSQNRMIGYGITDDKGRYAIEIESDNTPLQLVSSAMGYESIKIDINNESQTKNITLKAKDFELKELVVESERMWKRNDTLVYSVDAFKNQQDRSIADLLKKLPGVEVSESGTIKYQGEAINKFYIEGMDLMQSKYGLATNNLPVGAVQNVEVIENHQPIKSLTETVFSDKAAINLKLRDGKMGKPVGSITGGTGVEDEDWLWILNLFGLQANKTNQTMAMYKTNNIGLNIAKEMKDHTSFSTLGGASSNPVDKQLFDENIMTDMQLEDKRYLFNKSHLVTVNHLRKIKKEKEIRINANYLYDEQEETVEQHFFYFSPTAPLYIDEISKPEKTSNQGNIALSYIENSEKFYLNNKLDTKLKWSKLNNPILSSEEDIHQDYSLDDYKISNNLQLVKNMNKKVWNITSKIDYTYKPQSLIVNNDDYTSSQVQDINYKGIYADLQTSYSISNRHSTFSMKGKIMNQNEHLNSDLQSSLITDSTKNELGNNHFQFSLTPRYQWGDSKTKIIIEADINQNILSIENKYYQEDKNYSPLLISPKTTINRKLNPYWEGTLSYSYNQQLGDVLDFMSGYVQYDYRNYTFKSGILSERESHVASIKFNYKNVLQAFFFNTSLTYINANKNLLNKMQFNDMATLRGNFEKNNQSSSWMWYGYLGKHLNSISSNISLSTNISLSESQKVQQLELYPINNTNLNAIFNWSTKFSDVINIAYKGAFNYNIRDIKTLDGATKNNNHQLSQTINCYYSPSSHWELGIQGEHLYTKLTSNDIKNVFFGDISARYLHSAFDISIIWNNIFNRKKYETTAYHDLNTYTYSYKLRPSSLVISITFKY